MAPFARAAAVAAAVLLSIPAAARADGADLYKRHCSICHQAGGVGVPGVYPRLAGRAPKLAALPAGRTVMISAALFGMTGRLEVDGKPLSGVMPGFKQLTDAELAELLSYVGGLGGKPPKAFTVAEVAAVRSGPRLTPAQTNALARALPVK